VPASIQPKRLPLDRETIENKALEYLDKFDASSAKLHRILIDFVKRRAQALGVDPKPFLDVAREIVERYQSNGLVDNRRYALTMARSLANRGVSRQAIKSKLVGRGISSEVINEVTGRLAAEGGSELASARALVKKRKLGKYRPEQERGSAMRRDLGVLARAGFDFQTSKTALELEGIEDDETF
jgi:regulatory protein